MAAVGYARVQYGFEMLNKKEFIRDHQNTKHKLVRCDVND